MSTDSVLMMKAVFLLVLGVGLVLVALRGLSTGWLPARRVGWRAGIVAFHRATQPIGFWFFFLLYVAIGAWFIFFALCLPGG